ncbi:MAG TPA: hypothetical protein VE131_07275 [Terriglobales bacterium]|nr:hypothetical protein [Terriglobales bacterium]
MERRILFLTIPLLDIALQRSNNPALKSRPVAIAAVDGPRSRILNVSEEARKEGIGPGMVIRHARLLCPGLHVVPPNPRLVRLANHRLLELIHSFTPICENTATGAYFLDLTGTDRLLGCGRDVAARIEREIASRYRLAGAAGLASNKLVSRVAASLIEPLSICDVDAGNETSFLAPLSVNVLPGLERFLMPHPTRLLGALQELKLQFLRDIANLPLADLELVLGFKAQILRQWALGQDPSPVWPETQQPVFEISQPLATDEIDDAVLLGLLYGMVERLCRNLRRQKRACRQIRLHIQYSDGVFAEARQKFVRASCAEGEIFPLLKQLFTRSSQRRVRVREVTISAEAMADGSSQLDLFNELNRQNHPADRLDRLTTALDSIRKRHGEHAVYRGLTAGLRPPVHD